MVLAGARRRGMGRRARQVVGEETRQRGGKGDGRMFLSDVFSVAVIDVLLSLGGCRDGRVEDTVGAPVGLVGGGGWCV